ncbi:MAG: alpha/beta hydrolase-fold protein [Candidatus Aminicenantes bacterium]|nr:alpha/beta hydrolase-fold protein [Candidatus Aminicenantes bacterium]
MAMKVRNTSVGLILAFVLAASSAAAVSFQPVAPPAGTIRFTISVDPAIRAEPVSGRLLLLFSRTEKFTPGMNGTPVFGLNVDDLRPGATVSLDDRAFGYPVRRLSQIPEGDYYVQAWLNVYTTFNRADGKTVKLHMDQGEGQNWRRSPGNLFSDPVKVRLGGGAPEPPPLALGHVIPPLSPYPDTAHLKHLKIQSRLLSEFWGRPMAIGANILLPKGYDEHPGVRYPVHYIQGHFPRGGVARFSEDPAGAGFKGWNADNLPRFIQVTFEHACPYYDDSYGVNSDNIGPYGDAIVTELIPVIEKTFRAIGEPWARVLSGGSTGGWISLAMQVFYPDFFGGTWSFFPDPVDFRKYQVVNLYDDRNAYFIEHEWTSVPRGGERDTSGNLVYTQEQENLYEEAIGDRFRSGGQWAVWNALFAPVAADGYPKPLWDPVTGTIDHEAVQWAGERYDLRRYLEKNWPTIGPKLAGKIRVYCGRMDNFYLNEACYLLQESLEKLINPPYGGEFRYGDRGGHGWSPFKGDELLRELGARVVKSAAAGKPDWVY